MKRVLQTFLWAFLTTKSLNAQMTEIKDLSLLEKTLCHITKETLVIFDVDHVLIMPKHDYSLNRYPYRKKLWQDIKNKLSKEEATLLQSIVTASAEWQLIDEKVMKLLTSLKRNHIPAIALTSLGTGPLGIIRKREDLRFRELASVGIDFEDLSPLRGEVFLKEYAGEDGVPMLKKGIIFTAEIDKGKILKCILKKKNYSPKTILFIDDQLENLKSVAKACGQLGIKFRGFHYIAASLMIPPPIDQGFEQHRLHVLKTERRWLVRPASN